MVLLELLPLETAMAAKSRPDSDALFERACRVMPGGVNSPVRAFKSVGGNPPFIERGEGAHIWDIDGNEYIDYVASWGPLILGHAHPHVGEALARALERGWTYGAPCEAEVELAEAVVRLVPSIDVVRFVNSGTEATMSAVRVARGATGRDKIIKFKGCYHGHGDSFLIEAGSGALTLGTPSSPGVTKKAAEDTLIAGFNDLASMETLFAEHGGDIAGVILEPIAANMGLVLPENGFLQGIRDLCTKHGAVMILDEVMTGFRLGPDGAQGLYNIEPDLTTFGKVIGGGLPVGAFGGREDLMREVAPDGPIYQAGTLSGNPLAMTAGLATLEVLQLENAWEKLETLGAHYEAGVREAIEDYPLTFYRQGSMTCLYFSPDPVEDVDAVGRCDIEKFNRYFHDMLERGIYLAPSQYEAGFISLAHTPEDLDKTATALKGALRKTFGR